MSCGKGSGGWIVVDTEVKLWQKTYKILEMNFLLFFLFVSQNHAKDCEIKQNENEVEGVPAFSNTVWDQFIIVYNARMMAPVGSIHQKNLSARRAAANPTTLVTTSKKWSCTLASFQEVMQLIARRIIHMTEA